MQKFDFKADKNKCIHCGLCIEDCIANVITMDENNIPTAAFPQNCIKCQHCMAVCPAGAISILGKNPDNSEKIIPPNPEMVLNLIKSRRSDRNYKNESIDSVVINKLKDMLSWVPTGCNWHKLHFSIIEDIEVMDEFRNITNSKIIEALTTKPIDIVKNNFSGYLKYLERGEDIIFRNAPHIIVVSNDINAPCAKEDAIIALSYFELYAQSLNIGTCWCGFCQACLNIFPELTAYLEIPDGYKPQYVMLFGKKGKSYSRTTQPEKVNITNVCKKGL
ncbi:MAG: nitroreductase family protein [Candidatus Gastranaerophilales bacterium]|nr:nitroreductase family protein [Candidatus Gastranaerophilales bacterium]